MISFIPANGTTPQQVPLNAGQTVVYRNVLDSLWISQSADGTSGYRTNVAVVFPDAGGGAATVSVYDADGSLARTQELNLKGYSVVNDNVTGDSSRFAFEDLPAGTQDVLVNGVARANGRNNTFRHLFRAHFSDCSAHI
jgi:hypothetical protein